MSNPFPEASLAYLRDLATNNNKDWFQTNKKRYERDLKAPARELVAAVNTRMAEMAPDYAAEQPHKLLNRINRDIRFSKDKTPYNTHVWAGFHNTAAPKGSAAGLYFGLSADGLGVGVGVWKPPKESIESLRGYFAKHHGRYLGMVEDPAFSKVYRMGEVEAYKRVPNPYPPDHPAAELLKLKSVHYRADLDPALITSPGLVDAISDHFRQMLPLVQFLNKGLGVG